MSRPELLLTAPPHPATLTGIEKDFTVHRLWEQDDRDSFFAAVGPRIRGVATSTLYGRVDERLIDRLPSLEIIASFGVGYDNVDAQLAAGRGIIVTNTPGVLDAEVADFTIGLLIATLRQIPQADAFLRAGHWPRGNFPLSSSLRGRRVGILGLGNIGKAVARRLAGFDVPIAYHGRSRQPDVPYDYYSSPVALAEACDVLIVIVPGGASTRHLVDADVLSALGSNGVLINVARGSVVDQSALIAALQSGTVLAAGLDVYENEPNVPEALIAMPNIVLLPHIGSGSVQTRAAMGKLVADNLISWFAAGKPVSPVVESVPILLKG